MTPTSIPAIIVGFVLLLFGRKLFWLFVGVTGFIVGSEIAAALFAHQPEWIVISALVLGLIGALIAIFLQKVTIGIEGFFAGGYFLMALLRAWALQAPEGAWISFVIGGVIGAVVMIYLFDWALILFSAISGTYLIIHASHMNPALNSAVFVAMLVVGIVFQARILAPKEKRLGPSESSPS